MEKVGSSHSRTSDADDMALRVTQLGLTEMSIPEMINRCDERFKSAYAQGLGTNRRGEEYPLPKMHEAWPWGINGFNNSGQDGDRNSFLFEPFRGLSDDQVEEKAHEDKLFWDWLIEGTERERKRQNKQTTDILGMEKVRKTTPRLTGCSERSASLEVRNDG